VDTSNRDGRITQGGITFLQGLANVLGAAIERHRSESALRASEEQMRLIIEGAADYAIFTTDSDGMITSWSPGAQAIFGWTAEEAIGQSASLIFTPEDRARGEDRKEIETACRTGCANDERWHVRKDGGRVFMNGSMCPLHDGQGRSRGFLKVARDETERRKAEDAHRESERKLRLERGLLDAVIRQAPVGISIAFAEIARAAILNHKAAELLGHPAEEGSLERYELYRALHADGRPFAVHDYPTTRALLKGETIHQEEVLYGRPDGEIRRLEVSSAPVRDEAGRIVAAVTVFTDVEEQRRAEAANARLAAIVSSSSDAIVSFAAEDGRIMTWNKGAEDLFGYTEAEAVDVPVALLLPPPDRLTSQEDDTGVFRRAMRDGRIEVETVRRQKDSTLIDVSITATRMDGPDGRPIGVSGIFRDIRPRKQAEALLRERVEHQEVLVREVSHRVKNSLAMVASMLGLQSRAARDPEARRLLEEAQTRVETVAQVHDQLWRLENVQSVDLAPFLGGLCARLQETAPAGHSVVCDLESIVVPTDRAIPMGLLVNELVTNAFKYAYPVGGGEIRVNLALPQNDGIRLEVAAGRGGRSLGMRLVHGLARQLGGRLQISAAEPRGTRFTLDVPRAKPR
jgi:PAS domain S-box-containing protein